MIAGHRGWTLEHSEQMLADYERAEHTRAYCRAIARTALAGAFKTSAAFTLPTETSAAIDRAFNTYTAHGYCPAWIRQELESDAMSYQHPTKDAAPRTVTIVCQGPTQQDYRKLLDDYHREVPHAEVWILNKAARYMRGDLLWVMDDLEVERRKNAGYFSEVINAGLPIITCSTSADSMEHVPDLKRPEIFEYPLLEVIDHWGGVVLDSLAMRRPDYRDGLSPLHPHVDQRAAALHCAMYFHNSLPYMLAYAGFLGVRELNIFGADYTYGDSNLRENGRANAEYWIGMLRATGVRVRLTNSTTLCSQNIQPWFYGFARQPVIQGL